MGLTAFFNHCTRLPQQEEQEQDH